MYDVAIIGGGPIGIFSIFSCSLEGLSCAILDSASQLGGQCKMIYADKNIYDIPGHKAISGSKLIDNLLDQISCFNYDVFLNSFVSSLKKTEEGFEIILNNEIIYARSLVLALGAGIYRPVELSVPFDKTVTHDRILYSLNDIKKFQNKIVAVLGGGDSAIDFTIDLSLVARHVYLIHRRNVFSANNFSFNKLKSISNVSVHAPYSLKSIDFIDDKLLLQGNEEISVDYVFPCYGSVTNISFLSSWDLKLKGSKIEVDPYMMTSREGIFAIGDCVFYSGKRNLILSGFSESMIMSRSILKFLYPNKAFNTNYSTNSDIFK